MEDNKNEMIYITMYADDTGLFSEYECNIDNTVGFDIPRWILEDWYKKIKLNEYYDSFDEWVYHYNTCDDFIGFYNFCLIKGFVPQIWDENIDEIQDKVFYIDWDGNKQIVFEGTYDECRRWCRIYGWTHHDWKHQCKYDLELEVK